MSVLYVEYEVMQSLYISANSHLSSITTCNLIFILSAIFMYFILNTQNYCTGLDKKCHKSLLQMLQIFISTHVKIFPN